MNRKAMVIALVIATAACGPAARKVAIQPINNDAGMAAQDALARGDILFSRGEHALALDAYRRGMRKDPANARALNGVAVSYAAIGRHDLAREFFELALARAPGDERIHRNFARSLRAEGRRGEADALMAQLNGARPTIPAAGNRPTLAQLATGRPAVPTAAPERLASSGLERVSMGEVRLRTSSAGAALPGTMIPRLNTTIVTVTDAGKGTATVALTHQLNAPIVSAAGEPDMRPDCAPEGGKAQIAMDQKRSTGASEDRAEVSGKCASLAGGDSERDGLFQQLWSWGRSLG